MEISKKELEQELALLKSFGLTDEEFEGIIEFFEYTLEIKTKRICVLNSGPRKVSK